ncbi:MAG: glycosyltransferase family 4 protein [Acidimicrobiales bacterium]|nr:glycosyltransferase family 4 protein [Acidimicrobiales bacterium]
MRRLRVLVVIDSLGLGGAERLLVAFATAASSAGLDVEVASISSSEDPRNEMLVELRTVGIEPQFLGIPRLLSARAVPKLVQAIRTSGCDVVHAHLEYAATLATPAARLAGKPIVSTFHHVPSGRLSWRGAVRERLAVAVASRGQRTIFVSRASMAEFAHRYPRWQRRWMVVPNGIDLAHFTPDAASFPDDLGIPSGAAVSVLPAALRGYKGHEAAIEAWPEVRAAVPNAVLLFAGSGPQELALRALAEKREVAGSVVFAGFRTDVARLLQAASLVVLPSESEALPTVLMEAAACGRAAVASTAGGIPEVVQDHVTGLLVPPRDPEALAAAVTELLVNEGRRREMETAARDRAEAQFSLTHWAGQLREVYESAIG